MLCSYVSLNYCICTNFEGCKFCGVCSQLVIRKIFILKTLFVKLLVASIGEQWTMMSDTCKGWRHAFTLAARASRQSWTKPPYWVATFQFILYSYTCMVPILDCDTFWGKIWYIKKPEIRGRVATANFLISSLMEVGIYVISSGSNRIS